jgi:hypothetical protein
MWIVRRGFWGQKVHLQIRVNPLRVEPQTRSPLGSQVTHWTPSILCFECPKPAAARVKRAVGRSDVMNNFQKVGLK